MQDATLAAMVVFPVPPFAILKLMTGGSFLGRL
jgi:hypothetical protein